VLQVVNTDISASTVYASVRRDITKEASQVLPPSRCSYRNKQLPGYL
jgi:hypothetical protein